MKRQYVYVGWEPTKPSQLHPLTGMPLMKTSPVSELLTTRLKPSSLVPTYGMVAVAPATRKQLKKKVDTHC